MEGFEGFLEGEWESLSKMFSCEDSDLLLLHCNGTHANYEEGEDFLLPSNSSLECSHSSSEIESSHFAFFDHENRGEFAPTFDDHVMGFPTMIHDDLVGEMLQLKAQMLSTNHLDNGPKGIDDSCNEMQLKRKCEDNGPSQNPKKRNKRQPKKAKKDPRNDEEINNTVQSSSTSTSEEETHTASDSTGKAKTTKPPASDPQSLYARKRREKINERLKILQNLVPNGTKVDISTMLEEAVQYVKFLQLQIKLLSSDDMWMYAPIAYNGMDIGLYQKIVPSL